jgi:cell division protein FtsW
MNLRGWLYQRLALPRDRHPLHEPDIWLLCTLFVLVMFGTVMVFSASFPQSVRETGNGYSYLFRHLLWLAIGSLGFLVTSLVDYRRWRSLASLALLAALVLLALVLVPGVGVRLWGAQRWIGVGPFTVQPAELAKLGLALFFAAWLPQRGERLRSFREGLVPFALLLGLVVGLVMLQPDLGSATVLAIIALSMFFLAGAPLSQFALLGGAGVVGFAVLALGASYRRDRLLVFLSPDQDLFNPQSKLLNIGWQLAQARLAFASGGPFGDGLGASRQKFLWLPAAANDAIYAVIGEELGMVGCAFVLVLFLVLAWRGYRAARWAPDPFGSLLAAGITTWMVAQALINIGGITSTIPFTGIPLPFISYGGSALAVSLTAMGIVVNVSRGIIPHRVLVISGQSAARMQRVSVQGRHPSVLRPSLRAREGAGVAIGYHTIGRSFGRARRAGERQSNGRPVSRW